MSDDRLDIPGLVQRAADRAGFVRERYVAADLPTVPKRITVVPFFGDYRSQYVMSSLLLHRYIGEYKRDQYVILASHPGLSGLFPYVDEFWGLKDGGEVLSAARGFTNPAPAVAAATRTLNQYFEDVVDLADFSRFYDTGLTKEFFDTFGKAHVYLPPLRSLGVDVSRQFGQRPGYKVFVQPSLAAGDWRHGVHHRHPLPKQFWVDMCQVMLKANITPVLWQSGASHDLSVDFQSRCLYLTDVDVFDVLAVMRASSCVLDVFDGLGRYAAVARCPYLALTSRTRYAGLKEFELDDLTVLNKNYQYIFSQPTILDQGRWESLIDGVLVKLQEMLPRLDRGNWPPTSEYVAEASYASVRRRKTQRLGTRFIRVPRV